MLTSRGCDSSCNGSGFIDIDGYPLVCVSIPVYNGEAFLLEAIESALGQDYPNLRVVAVDNASTDATRSVLAGIRDERFYAYLFDEHVPVAESWERSFQCARGDYVLLLSADNILKPGALQTLVRALAPPSYGFAYGQSTTLIEGRAPQPFSNKLLHSRVGVIDDLERDVLWFGYTIAIDSILFRRSLPGLYMSAETRNACDLDLLLRLGKKAVKGVGIAEQVLITREHDRALSSDRSQMWEASLETYHRHALNSRLPRLYRRRIWRVLFWAVADALSRGVHWEARGYVERYGTILVAPQRAFLYGLLTFPYAGRLLCAMRLARSRFSRR